MSENIRAYCRVRPLNANELANGSALSFNVIDAESNNKKYGFCKIIGTDCGQDEVYKVVAEPLIDELMKGINVTIMAYGQTSSGKTYTLEGSDDCDGVTQKMIKDIFSRIQSMDSEDAFIVRLSYLEIYKEIIRDLLSGQNNLSLGLDNKGNVCVKDQKKFSMRNASEALNLFEQGRVGRKTGSTNMNSQSSRSHSVLSIHIERVRTNAVGSAAGTRTAVLHIVDLAGSEMANRTGANSDVLKEAASINKSLSELGNVVSALINNSKHVSYRNSKLTWMLRSSLGGNSQTAVVVCVSPATQEETQTLSSLKFGTRVGAIHNRARVNEVLPADHYRSLCRIHSSVLKQISERISNLWDIECIQKIFDSTFEKTSGDQSASMTNSKEVLRRFTELAQGSESEKKAFKKNLQIEQELNSQPLSVSVTANSLYSNSDELDKSFEITISEKDKIIKDLEENLNEKETELSKYQKIVDDLQLKNQNLTNSLNRYEDKDNYGLQKLEENFDGVARQTRLEEIDLNADTKKEILQLQMKEQSNKMSDLEHQQTTTADIDKLQLIFTFEEEKEELIETNKKLNKKIDALIENVKYQHKIINEREEYHEQKKQKMAAFISNLLKENEFHKKKRLILMDEKQTLEEKCKFLMEKIDRYKEKMVSSSKMIVYVDKKKSGNRSSRQI